MFSYCISPSAAGLGVPEIPPVPSSNAGTSHALSTGWLLGRVSDPTSAQYNSGSQEPKQGNSLLVQSCCPELLAHPAALLLLKLSSPGVQKVWGRFALQQIRCVCSVLVAINHIRAPLYFLGSSQQNNKTTFTLVVATVSFCFCFTDRSSWFSNLFFRKNLLVFITENKTSSCFSVTNMYFKENSFF